MGDVALTAPVIHSILDQNAELEITFLSRGFFEPLFNKHKNFIFKSADLKGKHKGVNGLRRLHNELKRENYDAVVDLHDVLRTKILRLFFQMSGVPVYVIDKGRKEKQQLIKGKIPFKALKHTQVRYLDVFKKAGMHSELKKDAFLEVNINSKVKQFISDKSNVEQKLIGIAPFAAHESKELGLSKIKKVIRTLTEEQQCFVFLFGGGAKEQQQLDKLSEQFEHCKSIVGLLSFSEELMLMSKLDAMIAMDSGNMHLASLVNTKVVSIWGATHHYLGFSPYNNEKYMVQVPKEDLPCRPCTVFGKLKTEADKRCAQKAMDGISVEMILEKLTD